MTAQRSYWVAYIVTGLVRLVSFTTLTRIVSIVSFTTLTDYTKVLYNR